MPLRQADALVCDAGGNGVAVVVVVAAAAGTVVGCVLVFIYVKQYAMNANYNSVTFLFMIACISSYPVDTSHSPS